MLTENQREKRDSVIKKIGISAWCIMFTLLIIQNNYPKIAQPEWIQMETQDEGPPYHFYNNQEYLSEIKDYCISGSRFYLLYKNNIMKIFSLDGTYVCSWAFKYANRGFSIPHLEFHEEDIYYVDNSYNAYVFHEGDYVSFISRKDWKHSRDDTGAQGAIYGELSKNAQLIRTGDFFLLKYIDKPAVSLFSRPKIYRLINDSAFVWLFFSSVLCCLASFYYFYLTDTQYHYHPTVFKKEK